MADLIPHLITVPEGFYELDTILDYLKEDTFVKESKTIFTLVKRKLQMSVTSNWLLDFSPHNSIGKILGFSSCVITKPHGTFYSDKPIDINSVNTIKIGCNLIRSNIEDFKRHVNTLYDFPSDPSTVGGKIIKEPNPICYFNVNTDRIYEIVITITDQDNNLIDFRGELLNITLDFRPIRSR